MLDADTGEVLAMANQPSYNPNNRAGLDPEACAIRPSSMSSNRDR